MSYYSLACDDFLENLVNYKEWSVVIIHTTVVWTAYHRLIIAVNTEYPNPNDLPNIKNSLEWLRVGFKPVELSII